jgi:membrane fusion protein, multidrug efflux system
MGVSSKPPTTATIEADITPVGFKIAGHVREVAIADNQPVKIGDLLVALDDRQLVSIVAGREAALAEKKARLVSAEQQVGLQGAHLSPRPKPSSDRPKRS